VGTLNPKMEDGRRRRTKKPDDALLLQLKKLTAQMDGVSQGKAAGEGARPTRSRR